MVAVSELWSAADSAETLFLFALCFTNKGSSSSSAINVPCNFKQTHIETNILGTTLIAFDRTTTENCPEFFPKKKKKRLILIGADRRFVCLYNEPLLSESKSRLSGNARSYTLVLSYQYLTRKRSLQRLY